jgi:Major Facilitator Superfamily
MGDEETATTGRGGWLNVGVAALLMVATFPGRSHGLGLFTNPILADFNLDPVVYGHINLWASLIGSLFCLPCGWAVDRFGTRSVLTVVVLGLGATVVAFASASTVAVLAVLILLTRGLGQSALSVVSLGVVGKTAFRRREAAMAVFAVLVGFGFATVVWAVTLLERYPVLLWRDDMCLIGLALLLVVLPVSWYLVREPGTAPEPTAAGPPAGDDFTFAAALRTQAFWAVSLTSALFLLVSSGTALFYEDVLRGFNFGRREYEEMLFVLFLFGAGFNALCGWLARRWSMTRLLGVGSLILAAALAALPFARTMSQLYLYAAAVACSGGIVTVVFFIYWRPTFGAAHVGLIQGAAQLLTVVASAVSQWLFPAARAWFGSYVPLLQILAGAAAVLGLWAWLVSPPRR